MSLSHPQRPCPPCSLYINQLHLPDTHAPICSRQALATCRITDICLARSGRGLWGRSWWLCLPILMTAYTRGARPTHSPVRRSQVCSFAPRVHPFLKDLLIDDLGGLSSCPWDSAKDTLRDPALGGPGESKAATIRVGEQPDLPGLPPGLRQMFAGNSVLESVSDSSLALWALAP